MSDPADSRQEFFTRRLQSRSVDRIEFGLGVREEMTGNLVPWALDRVLRYTGLAKKSGLLVGQGDEFRIKILTEDGHIRYVQANGQQDEKFAIILGIDRLQLMRQRLLSQSTHMTPNEFAVFLLSNYGIQREEILPPLIRFYRDTLFGAGLWSQTVYTPSNEKTPSGIIPANLHAQEVADQIAERVERTLSFSESKKRNGFDLVPHLLRRPEMPGFYEQKAMYYMDGHRTVSDIAQEIHAGKLETLGICLDLMDSGAISLKP